MAAAIGAPSIRNPESAKSGAVISTA
ncbi:hypothetical protein EYZ11_000679 [Aspergillus tanneri]|uniref:Uncharacterized protein n=1 Tax=Aspergillus tanneri TaxID=1220188 RepID=A0A4S3JWQ3_9EURO|nr:hypothetical protein EYZ11_000679 [Aspergillus tanneri]